MKVAIAHTSPLAELYLIISDFIESPRKFFIAKAIRKNIAISKSYLLAGYAQRLNAIRIVSKAREFGFGLLTSFFLALTKIE